VRGRRVSSQRGHLAEPHPQHHTETVHQQDPVLRAGGKTLAGRLPGIHPGRAAPLRERRERSRRHRHRRDHPLHQGTHLLRREPRGRGIQDLDPDHAEVLRPGQQRGPVGRTEHGTDLPVFRGDEARRDDGRGSP